MHSAEAVLKPYTDALPNMVFGRDKIGEAFADERQAGERCNVDDGGL